MDALMIVEADEPHKRCCAMIKRTLAIVAARSGDSTMATELCMQAQAMGDEKAGRILTGLRQGRTELIPDVISPRDAVELRFL
jgi:hypothetical protein